jgi:CBS domain-containing protein
VDLAEEVDMKVRDIMTTRVVSVAPDTPYKDVVERLVRAEVSSLPVVDEHGTLVGIVTEADLISKEAYDGHRRRALALLADLLSAREHHWVTKAAGTVAADVMSRNVLVCRPDETVRSVAKRMLERGVKRMPVLDSGVLVGTVSRQDILAMFDRPDEAIAVDVEMVLRDTVKMPEDHHVKCAVDQGIVTLTGDVRYRWDEAIVVALVREVAGVIDVVSQLRHREPNPRASTTPWMFGAR